MPPILPLHGSPCMLQCLLPVTTLQCPDPFLSAILTSGMWCSVSVRYLYFRNKCWFLSCDHKAKYWRGKKFWIAQVQWIKTYIALCSLLKTIANVKKWIEGPFQISVVSWQVITYGGKRVRKVVGPANKRKRLNGGFQSPCSRVRRSPRETERVNKREEQQK